MMLKLDVHVLLSKGNQAMTNEVLEINARM